MRIAALSVVALLVPCISQAECWTVEHLAGYSAKAFDRYKVSPDGLTGQRFQISISENKASVSPANGLSCSKSTPLSVVCATATGSTSTTEIWALDPSLGKAYQAQTRAGYGPLDGATLFVGEITGKCQ